MATGSLLACNNRIPPRGVKKFRCKGNRYFLSLQALKPYGSQMKRYGSFVMSMWCFWQINSTALGFINR